MKVFFNRWLPVGTRSVLFGAHCFFIHPFFVAAAWKQLYGPAKDWRLWAAFFLHDLGYWGKPNMDGPEGESHPAWGADMLKFLVYLFEWPSFDAPNRRQQKANTELIAQRWHDFSYYHSRFLAKRDNKPYSLLCVADKLACAFEPDWLYIVRVWLSGELWEYMSLRQGRNDSKYAGEPDPGGVAEAMADGSIRGWRKGLRIYCQEWAMAHKDGREDTWTHGGKETT